VSAPTRRVLHSREKDRLSASVAGALERPRANLGTYAGLFLVTLSTLMYEVLLTRIFSVTM